MDGGQIETVTGDDGGGDEAARGGRPRTRWVYVGAVLAAPVTATVDPS